MRVLLTQWWFWTLLISSFIAVAAGFILIPPQESSWTKFIRIQERMTREQVERIIGGKEDLRCTSPSEDGYRFKDGTEMTVHFDRDGCVERVDLVVNPEPTIFDMIHSWFEL